MNSNEIRQTQKKHVEAARAIADKADAEKRDMTQEEQDLFANEMATADKFAAKLNMVTKLEAAESTLKQSAGRYSQPQELAPVHSEIKRYSLIKAVRDTLQFGRVQGLEKEVSDEIALQSGKAATGFYMPLNKPLEKFGFLDPTTGAGAVVQNTDFANFIELLRSKMLSQKLGCRVLTDLKGNVHVPRQSGGATAYWITAQGSNTITASNQTIDNAALAQKTVGVSTSYTRQFFNQTSLDVENFIMDDLSQVLAIELDRVGFAGTGSGSQPTGVLYDSNVTTVPIGTNGGAPTFALLVSQETTVATGNADIGNLAYVTTPAGRGKMKATLNSANTAARMLWENDTVNGYSAYASNQLPSNLTKGSGTALSACIFGNWQDLIYGLWGGVDIIVNPYTGDTAGSVRITMLQDADVVTRHPASFAIISDMVTT